MTRLQKMTESEHSILTRVLFGQSSPTPVSREDLDKSIEWQDSTLNDSQKDAIRFALASREVALIHGPPGTGKTHTLIELTLQCLKQGLRLLVCGPSNISVDNIVERLASHKVPMVRLGHPARLLPSVLGHSLEVLTKTSDAATLVQDIRSEMDSKQASIRKTRNGRERKAIYGEMRELRKEYRDRENKCVDSLVRGSKVVLATLHGAGGFHLKHQNFDIVIVDEASQALEASTWVPLLTSGASKVVLAGDHLQLPPTIKSSNIKDGKESKKVKTQDDTKLETTLFDRMLDMHGDSIKRMLTTQYRMHEKIMAFPSWALYDDKLVAADSVKARLLKDLPYGIQETEDTKEPLVFFDTQGDDFPEKIDDEDMDRSKRSLLGDSKSNEHEAGLVKMHVDNLINAGVKAEDIAVVTPYNGQLALVSALLKEKYPGLELGSIDGFQGTSAPHSVASSSYSVSIVPGLSYDINTSNIGREKEAVVVSLVRSNPEHEVGFLGEKRRLNGKSAILDGATETKQSFSRNDSPEATFVHNRQFGNCWSVSCFLPFGQWCPEVSLPKVVFPTQFDYRASADIATISQW